jgi:hypothetical protein
MKKIFAAVIALSLIAAAPSYAWIGSSAPVVKPCRDAKGKFIKCKMTAPAPKKKPCRDAKGKFTKCPA